MTAEQFAYWLQGYAELNAEPPSAEQWQSIRDHLSLVFHKVTPAMPVRTDRHWFATPQPHVASLDASSIAVRGGDARLIC